MRRLLYILAAALLAIASVSCTKDGDAVDVTGVWELTDTAGLIAGDGLDIQVYVSFSNGSFEMYQSLGEDQVRFWLYTGTYTVSGDVLTGRYSDGTRLGGVSGQGYRVSLRDGNLYMTAVYSNELSEYKGIAEIPAEVVSNSTAPVRSAEGEAPVPVL